MAKITAPDIQIPASDMKKIGDRETQLIEKDARAGKTQNPSGSKTSPYKSESYKANKKRGMKRKTNRTGSIGTLYAGYISVRSTETSFKNYTLTTMMWRRLHIKNPKVNEVTVEYDEGDSGKVLGAREAGDELVGLNNKNINVVKDMIITKMNKGLVKWARKDINLVVG